MPLIPSSFHARVWLDFDGTITRRDVLDDLIQQFALDDSWKQVEALWQKGLIGSRECLRQEFELIRLKPTDLAAFLETVQVDSGFSRLMQTLKNHRVPAAILSDGIDFFIAAVLKRNGITDLPIRSNSLSHVGDRLSLQCPNGSDGCESAAAHCKCASATMLNVDQRKTIYVGDGRSDLCPARKADVVFAKNALATALRREQIPFIEFESLTEVAEQLEAAWESSAVARAARS